MAGKKANKGRPKTKIRRNVNRVLMVIPGSTRFRVDRYAKEHELEKYDAYREILGIGLDSVFTEKQKKQLGEDWDNHVAEVIKTGEDSEYFVKPRNV